jgi:hypothetical protein
LQPREGSPDKLYTNAKLSHEENVHENSLSTALFAAMREGERLHVTDSEIELR